ncbi:MAG: hypothetical protein ACM3ZV_07415 [Bacillota bacterium]
MDRERFQADVIPAAAFLFAASAAAALHVAAPDPPAKIATTATITSAAITAVASGNTGAVTFAWTKKSGDALTTVTPDAATTAFRGANMVVGEVRTATFTVTATDDATGAVATDDVTVTVRRVSQPVATPSTTSVSATGTTSTVTTATVAITVTGGTAPFTHNWAKISGAGISAVSPTSKDTAFRAVNLNTGDSRSATFRYTVTDANGIQASCDVAVTIRRTSSATPPTFTPAAGDYSAAGEGSAAFSFTCDRTATWTWQRTSGLAGGANIASGGTGTSITFTLTSGLQHRISTFTITGSVDGVSVDYTLTLAVAGTGSGIGDTR